MTFVTPILLAGGSGKRLWPSSRKSYPKQFIELTSDKTLFQQSALRFKCSDIVKFNPLLTVTNANFRFVVREQLETNGIDAGRILIEPEGKNTAPAIIAATILALKDNKDAIIITSPSDHIIPNTKYFHEVILTGIKAVNRGNIVTFGICPTSPETGYGYLKLKQADNLEPKEVLRFIEKPNQKSAMAMLNQGDCLWNSGIFMFRGKDMINAFRKYAKEILLIVEKAVKLSVIDLDFIRLDSASWSSLETISIDYAIMEKTDNLVAIPYNDIWSDLGDWDAVWRETKKDDSGVVLSKNAHAIDCKNTLLRSENNSQHIVGLGLQNIVAVAMQDAVLVADKNKSQDVKKIVEYLKLKNISQSEVLPKDYRPWGWFESVISEGGFKVKKIFVKPGAALSLQSHKYRSEHWVVISGTAKVTINEDIKLLSVGQSTYVPEGSLHRLENPYKTPTKIIEIQIGTYLEEDDIIRYDDLYSRK